MAVTTVRVSKFGDKPEVRKPGLGLVGIFIVALTFFMAGYVYSATTDGSTVVRNCVAQATSYGLVDDRRVPSCLQTIGNTGAFRWFYENLTRISLLPFQGAGEKQEAVDEVARANAGFNKHDQETARVRLVMTAQ